MGSLTARGAARLGELVTAAPMPDTTTGMMAAGIVYRVVNTGNDAVLVSTPWLDFSTPGPWIWLDPGERDALFWAGQMAGSDIGPGRW